MYSLHIWTECHQPTEVSYWQKSHRPWKDQGLRMKPLAQFEKDWWSWWKSLQPNARGANDTEYMQPSRVDMDWTTLRAPGRNGFLLVMVSLTWWGKLSGCSDAWQLAMLDVTVTLVCLCAQPVVVSTSGSLKRKRCVQSPASRPLPLSVSRVQRRTAKSTLLSAGQLVNRRARRVRSTCVGLSVFDSRPLDSIFTTYA